MRRQKLLARNAVEDAEEQLCLAVASFPSNVGYLLTLAQCIAVHAKDPARALPWYELGHLCKTWVQASCEDEDL